MFGFRFIKAQPTSYVIVHRKGEIVREGAGLSLFCYAPTTNVSLLPLSSCNEDFIFEQSCADFQLITVQGQLSYRIEFPLKTASLLNFAVKDQMRYISDDPIKLSVKVIKVLEGLMQRIVQRLPLKEALLASGKLAQVVTNELREHVEITALGLDIMSITILAIKPQPETAKALEAKAREAILKAADDAIFARRNAAVENERTIRENELDTEIAVEHKKRSIRETQIEAEASIQQKQQAISQTKLTADITLEEQRKTYVACKAANLKTMAEAEAHRMAAVVDSLKSADPRIVQALAASGMDPAQLIAQAFTGIADKADKIGQLNLSPDLLHTLMEQSSVSKKGK